MLNVSNIMLKLSIEQPLDLTYYVSFVRIFSLKKFIEYRY